MSNWKSWIFNDESSALADSKAARRRAALLSASLALMGLFALVLLVHDGLLGGLNRQKAMTLLSAAAVCVGLIALIFAVSSKKQAIKAAATKTTGEKPWLNRKDWMDGRVKSSSRKAVWLLWIFIAFWCGVSGVISLFIVPAQLNQGNRAALCILIFPVVGLVMIQLLKDGLALTGVKGDATIIVIGAVLIASTLIASSLQRRREVGG